MLTCFVRPMAANALENEMRTAITSRPIHPIEDYEADLTDFQKPYLDKLNPPKRNWVPLAAIFTAMGAGMFLAAWVLL